MVMILWLFCRSMMVGGFDRDDVRSIFGLSIDIDDFGGFVDRWWWKNSLVFSQV